MHELKKAAEVRQPDRGRDKDICLIKNPIMF
jgi:hypothetical protein